MDFNSYVRTFQTKVELGCERMKLLLKKIGDPQKDLNVVHIAGTNGKGSVCAFLESMLVKQGKKVGIYSSPELISKNEVIRFCAKDISDKDLNMLISGMEEACDEVRAEYGSEPSQFEIITACAFVYFKKMGAEIVVLEVGMGGEGDATNVCENTKISVITKIDIDHTVFLGNSKNEIAAVKAGIIKENCVTVTTFLNDGVMDVIRQKCSGKKADLEIVRPFESVGFNEIYENISFGKRNVRIALGGENQLENAALAVKTAQILNIDEESIVYGLEHACHRGRFERLKENVYYDGAHNINGIKALKKNVLKYFKNKKIVYIMAMMKDKDFCGAIDILNDDNSEFKFVTASVTERAMKSDEMQKIAESRKDVLSKKYNCVKDALRDTDDENAVVIGCGSLYFYKDFISAL